MATKTKYSTPTSIERSYREDPLDPQTLTRKAVIDEITHDKLDEVVAAVSGPDTTTFVAAENISATKLVYSSGASEVSLADPSAKPQACVIGVAQNTVASGGNSQVITSGTLSDSTFNFTAGEILYLGASGNITSVVPTVGVLTVVGEALGDNKILIRIETPITL